MAKHKKGKETGNHDVKSSIDTVDSTFDAEQQFEVESLWCIKQLENTLASGKLKNKQERDAEKILKCLKSSTEPLIKKRQLMRSACGKYRQKMVEEEKKMKQTNKIRFSETKPEDMKFQFIRKAALSNGSKISTINLPEKFESTNPNDAEVECVNSHFKFNFTISKEK